MSRCTTVANGTFRTKYIRTYVRTHVSSDRTQTDVVDRVNSVEKLARQCARARARQRKWQESSGVFKHYSLVDQSRYTIVTNNPGYKNTLLIEICPVDVTAPVLSVTRTNIVKTPRENTFSRVGNIVFR